MNGKQHMKLGAAVGISGALFLKADVVSCGVFAIGSIIGALLPDMDSPTSRLGRCFPLLSKLFNKGFGHRGLFHSPLFLFVTAGIYWLIKIRFSVSNPYLISGILTGMSLHLLQDMMTVGGIPLFYPFTQKKISIGCFKSESKVDIVNTNVLCVFGYVSMFLFFGIL